MDYFNETAGEKYANLGIGGGGMRDQINLFWWCASKTKLKNVYFAVSFYHMRKNDKADLTTDVIPLVNKPLKYLINRGTITRTIKMIKSKTENIDSKDSADKKTVLYNSAENIYNVCRAYELNYDFIDEIIKISDYCKDNKINLVLFNPPCSNILFDKVIKPLKIDEQKYISEQILSQNNVFLDMEFESEFNSDDNNFTDCLHISNKQYHQYIDAMIKGEGNMVRRLGSNNF